MTEPRVCGCHGERMYWSRDARRRNGGQWRCAVQHREKARAKYAERMATTDGRERQREKWRRNYEDRKADPIYQLQRQLYELTRVRVT